MEFYSHFQRNTSMQKTFIHLKGLFTKGQFRLGKIGMTQVFINRPK